MRHYNSEYYIIYDYETLGHDTYFQTVYYLRKDQVSVSTGNSSMKWAQVNKGIFS